MFAANLRLHQQDSILRQVISKIQKKMLTIAFRQSKTPNKPTREVTRKKKTVLFYETILLHRKVCHGDFTASTSTQRVLFIFALQHNFLAYQT